MLMAFIFVQLELSKCISLCQNWQRMKNKWFVQSPQNNLPCLGLWHRLSQAKSVCDHRGSLAWHAALTANWPHAQPLTPFLNQSTNIRWISFELWSLLALNIALLLRRNRLREPQNPLLIIFSFLLFFFEKQIRKEFLEFSKVFNILMIKEVVLLLKDLIRFCYCSRRNIIWTGH